MNASFNRRISIASCWAASRIALFDSVERYEDSYAISQEFCEWITCLNTHPEGLEASLSGGKTLTIDGTNVIRVPFGIREPRKKRPEQPERLATLILTFQSEGNPTPPPQAA